MNQTYMLPNTFLYGVILVQENLLQISYRPLRCELAEQIFEVKTFGKEDR